jgi:hypothetical protein
MADAAPPEVKCWIDSASPISCDFSCAATSRPTAAPDPIMRSGSVREWRGTGVVSGATVEVRSAGDDTVLATTTTMSGVSTAGRFTTSIATGGTAPALYVKIIAAGHLESYEYDPYPAFDADHASGLVALTATDSVVGALYQSAGLTHDAARGTLQLQVLDCAEHGVSGATVAVADTGVRYNSGAGGTTADPRAIATDSSATAWLLDAPAGSLDLTIRAGEVTFRSWKIVSYANAFTYAQRVP